MRDFGESLLVYRPPIDTRSVKAVMGEKSNGNPEKALNFLTLTRNGVSTRPTAITC